MKLLSLISAVLLGVLISYGIAPYKLTHQEALDEINWLKLLGIEFRLGLEIGSKEAEEMLQCFDAIYLGVGLGEDRLLASPEAIMLVFMGLLP